MAKPKKDSGKVQSKESKVEAARIKVANTYKSMKENLSDLKKSIKEVTKNWDSKWSQEYQSSALEQIKKIEEQQKIIEKTLENFMEDFLEKFSAAEAKVAKSADLFDD